MVWNGEKREAVGQAERGWHGKNVQVYSSFYCLTCEQSDGIFDYKML